MIKFVVGYFHLTSGLYLPVPRFMVTLSKQKGSQDFLMSLVKGLVVTAFKAQAVLFDLVIPVHNKIVISASLYFYYSNKKRIVARDVFK